MIEAIFVPIAISAWIACCVKSYQIVRAHYLRRAQEWFDRWGTNDSVYRWTTSQRRKWLMWSAFGPISLLASWSVYSDPYEKVEKDANW